MLNNSGKKIDAFVSLKMIFKTFHEFTMQFTLISNYCNAVVSQIKYF